LLALRDAMTAADRALASAAICNTANALLATRLAPGEVVALYSAKGSEVDTARIDGFARRQGWGVAYPRVIAGTRRLAFHTVALDELAASRFELHEPNPDAPGIEIADIAAFVVPGLAFDRTGGRIGWGRGHYDATFAASSPRALRIGLAYERQVIEHVAREAHDVAVHLIITEVSTHMVV
jgi:5-formyltetrahydrofolate cyclo-ligase